MAQILELSSHVIFSGKLLGLDRILDINNRAVASLKKLRGIFCYHSIISRNWVGCCAAGATCNDRRSLLHTAGGLVGAVSPLAGPGQSPGGGPGGEAPGSSDTFAFSSSK